MWGGLLIAAIRIYPDTSVFVLPQCALRPEIPVLRKGTEIPVLRKGTEIP
jgi:hypothetical protein